jgi:hypothetical protein
MLEAQGVTTPGRPWHLWLIGIIEACGVRSVCCPSCSLR